jgi:hypothetical protein
MLLNSAAAMGPVSYSVGKGKEKKRKEKKRKEKKRKEKDFKKGK